MIVGNNIICVIAGSGSVVFRTAEGNVFNFERVLYVSFMIKNLIFILRFLDIKLYRISFD